jgi:hypothetical protein
MDYENAGPRMAFTVDGKVLFFDEKGTQIKDMKKLREDEFIDMFNDPKHTLQHAENISVFSFKVGNPECKIVFWVDGVRYCYWVDCLTGKYIRPC